MKKKRFRIDRSADGCPKLVALQNFALRREETARVQLVIAEKVEQHSMEVVGARLCRGVQHATRAAELGRIGVLLHLELLQGVDGSLNERSSLVLLRDVDAIEGKRDHAPANAADRSAIDKLRTNTQHVPGAGQETAPGVRLASS